MNKKKRLIKVIGFMLMAALLAGSTGRKVSAMGNFTDTVYVYRHSEDGEYSDTAWRTKDYQLPDERGYVYVIASYVQKSKVRLRGCLHDAALGTRTNTNPCSNWIVAPFYQHCSLYNWYNTSTYNEVKLRATTVDGTAETGGNWSPDCSKVYTVIGK